MDSSLLSLYLRTYCVCRIIGPVPFWQPHGFHPDVNHAKCMGHSAIAFHTRRTVRADIAWIRMWSQICLGPRLGDLLFLIFPGGHYH